MQPNRRTRRSFGKLQKRTNNRSNKLGGRNYGIVAQVIYSEPLKIIVDKILTNRGKKLLKLGHYSEEELAPFYKNKYGINPNAKPIKRIYHEVN